MTIFASLLELDRHALKAERITDVYSLHRTVYGLFADVRDEFQKASGQSSGILFADKGGDHTSRRILILSNRPPITSNSLSKYVHTKQVPDSFFGHDRYQFEIDVNPTKRERKTGNLVPVKGRENIGDWFCHRADTSWGFSVVSKSLEVGSIDVLRFKAKEGRLVTIECARIKGTLVVKDRERFKSSVTSGIGRGRAFGCGLLQISPIRNIQGDTIV